MRALVINLDSETERLSQISAQLGALNIPFERLSAVTDVQAASMQSETYWSGWERPLKDVEKACLLSHVNAWNTVVERGQPCLILEDDAVLASAVPELLAALETAEGYDHLSLETRARRKLVSRSARMLTPDVAAHRLLQDRTGAAAYVLWPSGAQKLLAHVARRPGLADAVICVAYDLKSYQTDPACAIQQDCCHHYGVALVAEHRSLITAGAQSKAPKTLAHRLRRIWSQLRMGGRLLRYWGRSERREVQINAAHFPAPKET